MSQLPLVLTLAAVCCSAPAEQQTATVSGTVIYAEPYSFFVLRSGDTVIRVTSSQGNPELKPGDIAAATGTPARREGRPSLEVASYERIGEGAPLPVPRTVSIEELESLRKAPNPDPSYGLSLRVKSRLLAVEQQSWGETEIRLASPSLPVFGCYRGTLPEELVHDLRLRPIVEISGVLDFDQSEESSIQYSRLRIPDISDIKIVPDAEFMRRRAAQTAVRLLWAIPPLLFAAVICLLVKLYRSRAQRRRLEAVIAERKRMAADLHDTIEQHLAGARLYLESMLPDNGAPASPDLKPVELAREILIQAKREIRETVWNLRTEELLDKNPAVVLQSLAERMSASGAYRVETILRGLPDHLPERIFSDILYIIQESITNAVKHGGASRIVIAADSDSSGLQFAVLNNGKPFDVKSALGPEAGHFGLSGMRERARRGGFSVSFKSSRKITSVRIRKEKP